MFGQGLAIVLMVGFLIGFSPVVFMSGQALADGSDNFDGATIDLTKWAGYDPSEEKGQGQISQVNGHLEYTTSGNGTSKDSYDHKWIFTEFPYDYNWSIEITVTNNSIFPESNKWSSFGINVRSKMDQNDEIEIELAAMMNGANMFWSEFQDNNVVVGEAFQNTTLRSAPIRLSFNSSSKLFEVLYYDNGWFSFGSFDVNASGLGVNGSANWGMADTDKFIAYVFGYSENMLVYPGVIYGDDFSETGGIEPPLPVASATTGSLGTTLTIDGSGFGASRGSVLIGNLIGNADTLVASLADTASAATAKPVKTKITTWGDTSISLILSKAIPAGIYDIMINPKVKPPDPIFMTGAFTVTNPVIDTVEPLSGNNIGDEITISGSFFGTKKGKVYLEDLATGKMKKCKVTIWDMNPTTGVSTITFTVPKLQGGIYPLYVTNKIGTTRSSDDFGIGLTPSDRNLKENITLLDGKEVLTRLAGIPVSSWNYTSQGPSIRHIGPMAQDFKSAFNVGESDRFINMVDSGGVALASIQGLYTILQEKEKEIRNLKNENLELKEEIRGIGKRLAAIEHQIPK
jgi:hypothetical protein